MVLTSRPGVYGKDVAGRSGLAVGAADRAGVDAWLDAGVDAGAVVWAEAKAPNPARAARMAGPARRTKVRMRGIPGNSWGSHAAIQLQNQQRLLTDEALSNYGLPACFYKPFKALMCAYLNRAYSCDFSRAGISSK
jgi:hypothetical protein